MDISGMSACIDEVAAWMRSNRLQLNTAKTEFLWSTTSRRLHQLPQLPRWVGSTTFHQLPPFETLEFTSTAMSRWGLMWRKWYRPATRYCINCELSVGQCRDLFFSRRWCRLLSSRGWTIRQFDTRRRFITSLVTAAVSDDRRRSAHLFLVVVPAHHSAPSSAALAEGSRVDCIQTISPRVQVSTRVRTCIPYWRALSGGRCRGLSQIPFQFIFIIDCQPHPTPYCRWPSFPGRRCTCLEQSTMVPWCSQKTLMLCSIIRSLTNGTHRLV